MLVQTNTSFAREGVKLGSWLVRLTRVNARQQSPYLNCVCKCKIIPSRSNPQKQM